VVQIELLLAELTISESALSLAETPTSTLLISRRGDPIPVSHLNISLAWTYSGDIARSWISTATYFNSASQGV